MEYLVRVTQHAKTSLHWRLMDLFLFQYYRTIRGDGCHPIHKLPLRGISILLYRLGSGDFNAVRSKKERKGLTLNTKVSRNLNKLLSDLELLEIKKRIFSLLGKA